MTELGPELEFVCACCSWPDDGRRRSRLTAAAALVADWGEVGRVAREHRVEGLVAQATAAVGVGAGLAAAGERVKRRALDDLAETIRVARALDGAGLVHAILKGVPLGVRAFRTPVIKQSWDIDVLVEPADAVAAANVLATLGYAPHMPARPFTTAEFERWSPVSKEAEFRSAAGRTVELHWGVADHPMLLPRVTAATADGEVELLDGAAVRTLGDAANLAYLAVHGASHGWSRLKWLADFAAFFASVPPADRGRLVEDARQLGTGHALDQALGLSRRLLDLDIAPQAASAEAKRLAALAVVAIRRRGAGADFESDSLAQGAIREIRRKLMPGARYRMILVGRALRGSEDRRLIALPKKFHWAYAILRPFSAIFRTLLRRAHRSRNGVCPGA